jgi:hypothetical protein
LNSVFLTFRGGGFSECFDRADADSCGSESAQEIDFAACKVRWPKIPRVFGYLGQVSSARKSVCERYYAGSTLKPIMEIQ